MMNFTQRICGADKASRRSIRHGATLIDVAVGAALLSLVLIPALGLMGQTSQLLQRLDVQDQLLFEAERIIEQTKIDLCDPVQFATRRGTFDAVVVGNETTSMRSRLTIEDSLTPSLLTMDALVWEDRNNNGQPDEGELSQQLRTQWSQL
ncbi:MAG: hypothetical protein CMM00_05770 [Rhodopirellula sp.]|jgi:type II secretory pathway component PulJ|uniref:Uncharacterized protein n=1 Tax=Rhodopirellula europaea SH398 TaxID=1263868 RepID=M5S957_9BACT|nr:hypothetical protein [Rhodopirellula europaea]EMI28016.1 hypothetical protein RESH_01426 [Rhodopirellula europaea SH398]MAP08341.1 hypothetical protein [Rhodopirellula sp.]MCR9208679.1 hypothetical protein [bacterium]